MMVGGSPRKHGANIQTPHTGPGTEAELTAVEV